MFIMTKSGYKRIGGPWHYNASCDRSVPASMFTCGRRRPPVTPANIEWNKHLDALDEIIKEHDAKLITPAIKVMGVELPSISFVSKAEERRYIRGMRLRHA